MRLTLALSIALATMISAGNASPSETVTTTPPINLTAGPAVTAEMTSQIRQRDAELFAAIFDDCNAEKVAAIVTDDFEFYHDKWGQTANSKQQFVDAIAGMCKRVREGTDFRARRELIADSMGVYPLDKFGAVQTGSHRFYALVAGSPDRLTETAQFMHVWKHDNGSWKLARVISYDHQLAP